MSHQRLMAVLFALRHLTDFAQLLLLILETKDVGDHLQPQRLDRN